MRAAMTITSRRKSMIFFVVLGVCLVGMAVFLNVSWILLHWRHLAWLILGSIFFAALIAGLILNTTFLVREVRRNEQHDSFINAVTHELKTPVASIRLFLETLKTRPVDERQRQEFYDAMLADSDRLAYTINQVLRASGAHDSRAPRSLVDLPALVQECLTVARVRNHLPPEALTYAESFNGSRPQVLGDVEELRAAVFNLLDNAVKYSHQEVKVSVEVASAGDRRVAVRVTDHGVGIVSAELRRVFKRFYRARSRLVSRVKGTGLGLFIVRSVAEKHGGRAFAQSRGEGYGSTFTIELPVA